MKSMYKKVQQVVSRWLSLDLRFPFIRWLSGAQSDPLQKPGIGQVAIQNATAAGGFDLVVVPPDPPPATTRHG